LTVHADSIARRERYLLFSVVKLTDSAAAGQLEGRFLGKQGGFGPIRRLSSGRSLGGAAGGSWPDGGRKKNFPQCRKVGWQAAGPWYSALLARGWRWPPTCDPAFGAWPRRPVVLWQV